MRLPRFSTLQLLLLTTLAALLTGLITVALQWRPRWIEVEIAHTKNIMPTGGVVATWERQVYASMDAIPATARIPPMAAFIVALAIWAAIWGVVRKRGRESLAKEEFRRLENDARQRLPTPSAPLAMATCWGLMIVGGLVALGLPIVLMFTLGPLLFPTIYFSLFV